MKVAIGGDHAGFEYKAVLVGILKDSDIEVVDHGTSGPESVDYPDFVHPVASMVDKGEVDLGILICGSGNGVNMTANKYKNVRSALCWQNDIARLAREHNDANIIAIPARYVSKHMAIDMMDIFLRTKFEGGRHERRVKKISQCI